MVRVLEGVRATLQVLSLFLPSHFCQNRKRGCHPVLWWLSLEVSVPERKPGTLGETEVPLYDYCPLTEQAGWVYQPVSSCHITMTTKRQAPEDAELADCSFRLWVL